MEAVVRVHASNPPGAPALVGDRLDSHVAMQDIPSELTDALGPGGAGYFRARWNGDAWELLEALPDQGWP